MPASPLPLDIVEHIIDSFDDYHSLATYALVSRAWIARSRFHLFSDLTFTAENTAEYRTINCCPPSTGTRNPPAHRHRWAQFVSLLHANPHLALYVRTLTVQGSCSSGGPWAPRRVWHGRETFDITLFPSVRSLTFVRMDFESMLDLVPLMQSLPTLEELVLDELTFPPFPGHIPTIRTSGSVVLPKPVPTRLSLSPLGKQSTGPIERRRRRRLPTPHDLAGTILTSGRPLTDNPMIAHGDSSSSSPATTDTRPCPLPRLKKFSFSTVKNTGQPPEWEEEQAAAFARTLLDRGALSPLALELFSPGATTGWLATLPALGKSLQHCALSVAEVLVPDSLEIAPRTLEIAPHARENITRVCAALRALPALRSLCLEYDADEATAYGSIARRAHFLPAVPRPPLFLTALCDALCTPLRRPSYAHAAAEYPCPLLERLAFRIHAPAASLLACAPAVSNLARRLLFPARAPGPHAGDTDGRVRECEGACPRLRQVAVAVFEPRTRRPLYGPQRSRLGAVQALFAPFEAAGVLVEVRVEKPVDSGLLL